MAKILDGRRSIADHRQRFVAKNFAKIESSLTNMPRTYRYGPGGTKADRIDLDGQKVLLELKRVWDRMGGAADVRGMSSSARTAAYDE